MKIFSKKAQGLPLTTIVLAALGLIILVVLVAIFTGRMGIFGKDVTIAQTITCADSCIASGYSSGGKDLASGQQCADNEVQIFFKGKSCCCTK